MGDVKPWITESSVLSLLLPTCKNLMIKIGKNSILEMHPWMNLVSLLHFFFLYSISQIFFLQIQLFEIVFPQGGIFSLACTFSMMNWGWTGISGVLEFLELEFLGWGWTGICKRLLPHPTLKGQSYDSEDINLPLQTMARRQIASIARGPNSYMLVSVPRRQMFPKQFGSVIPHRIKCIKSRLRPTEAWHIE